MTTIRDRTLFPEAIRRSSSSGRGRTLNIRDNNGSIVERNQGIVNTNIHLERSRSSSQGALHDLKGSYEKSRLHQDRIELEHGTCGWLLNHSAYQSWRAATQGMLFILGPPGVGKSFVMKWALEYEEQLGREDSEAVVISFFFHNHGSELDYGKQEAQRGLLHQLFRCGHANKSRKTFEDEYKINDTDGRKKYRSLPPSRDLEKHLTSAIEECSMDKTLYVYCDALDEAGKLAAFKITQFLRSHVVDAKAHSRKLKVCLSCRLYPNISLQHEPRILVEEENAGDIARFVHTRLHRLQNPTEGSAPMPTSLANQLKKSLLRSARGLFLWVSVNIELASGLHHDECSEQDILARIEAPQDSQNQLTDLYEKLLKPKDGHMTAQTFQMFQWLCYAERDLTAEELHLAISKTFCSQSHDMLDEWPTRKDIPSSAELRKEMTRRSRGLARVMPGIASARRQTGKSRRAEERWIVGFIHKSVADYLKSDGLKILAPPEFRSLKPSILANEYLFHRCLSLLQANIDAPSQCYEHIPSWQTLTLYAAEFWLIHGENYKYKPCVQRVPDILTNVNNWREVISQRGKIFSESSRDGVLEPWHFYDFYRNDFPAHLFAHMGLRDSLTCLKQIDINSMQQTDNEGWTPLHRACLRGHFNVALDLMNTPGVDIGAISNARKITPLLAAANFGHPDIVRELIQRGSKFSSVTFHRVDSKPRLGKYWRERVSEVICSWKRPPKPFKVSPVSIAVLGGSLEVLSVALTDQNCKPSFSLRNLAKSVLGQLIPKLKSPSFPPTPLGLAIRLDRSDMVQKLLQSGASPVKCDTNVSNGYLSVNDQKSKRGDAWYDDMARLEAMPPLYWAAIGGNLDIIHMLIRKGACANQRQCSYSPTILSAALLSNNYGCCQYLVSNGANVRSTLQYILDAYSAYDKLSECKYSQAWRFHRIERYHEQRIPFRITQFSEEPFFQLCHGTFSAEGFGYLLSIRPEYIEKFRRLSPLIAKWLEEAL